MSSKVEKILALAVNFEKNASDELVAEAKKKEEKKLNPKAKVRNRGNVCVPAESAKDKKDHFPINNEAQARNALARVNQFTKVPDWYSGSLQSLVSLVAKKVKAKYPSIEVSKEAKKPGAKKAYLESFDNLLSKFGQRSSPNERIKVELENLKRLVNTPVDGSNAAYTLKKWPGELKNFNEKIDQALQYVMTAPLYATRATVREAIAQLNGFNTEMRDSNFDNTYLREANKVLAQIDTFSGQQTETAPAAPADGGEQKYWDDKAKWQAEQKPATPGIPYRKDVETAQQQLANMGGFDLGTSGRYGNGVDGQLGQKTRDAFKQYAPGKNVEEVIKELVQKYNAGPEPAKEETPTPAEQIAGPLPSVDEVYPTGAKPTWGNPNPAPTPAEQIAQK